MMQAIYAILTVACGTANLAGPTSNQPSPAPIAAPAPAAIRLAPVRPQPRAQDFFISLRSGTFGPALERRLVRDARALGAQRIRRLGGHKTIVARLSPTQARLMVASGRFQLSQQTRVMMLGRDQRALIRASRRLGVRNIDTIGSIVVGVVTPRQVRALWTTGLLRRVEEDIPVPPMVM